MKTLFFRRISIIGFFSKLVINLYVSLTCTYNCFQCLSNFAFILGCTIAGLSVTFWLRNGQSLKQLPKSHENKLIIYCIPSVFTFWRIPLMVLLRKKVCLIISEYHLWGVDGACPCLFFNRLVSYVLKRITARTT